MQYLQKWVSVLQVLEIRQGLPAISESSLAEATRDIRVFQTKNTNITWGFRLAILISVNSWRNQVCL